MGNKLSYLAQANELLCELLEPLEKSRVYRSAAVDYLDQPEFFNQVLSFSLPSCTPQECLEFMLGAENHLGRVRGINKGPRVIDIDILFWGNNVINSSCLQVPHPRLFQRSFIVLPLMELTCFKTLNQAFKFSNTFCNDAFPLDNN